MLDRRQFVALCSALGLTNRTFVRTLWADSQAKKSIAAEMVAAATHLADIELSEPQQQAIVRALEQQLTSIEQLHALNLPNELAPATVFSPLSKFESSPQAPARAANDERSKAAITSKERLPFASVRELGEMLRSRRITSVALTDMYLERLQRFDRELHFVINLTAERARAQAQEADREIAAGKYRGPLHGIPWGAKDLIAVRGYPTTWGAPQFAKRQLEQDATVVQRLDRAGAVLIAKLSLGTLAMGADEWFGGMTRNPWRPEEGALGSSAGSASAVAAGCVGFALGSETLDSISAPCSRCGATGLRPTFGRVPRTGSMALVWSMDKLGALCRTAEDGALVLAAINGADAGDIAAQSVPFQWPSATDIRHLRVGFLEREFHGERAGISGVAEPPERRAESERIDAAALDTLRKRGIQLLPRELPDLPWRALIVIPKAEAAAAFEELTRKHEDALLPGQQKNWPNVFRVARFIPAVDYINAERVRLSGMQAMEKLFVDIDVLVSPTSSVQLLVTNLTGHPGVVVPSGFRADGTPTSISFIGKLWGDAQVIALAQEYQRVTNWHTRHPQWLVV